MGYVLINKTLNKWGTRNILRSSWKEMGMIDINWVKDNTFIIIVQDESTTLKILDQVPWGVMKKNFSVKTWPQELALEEINMEMVLFWIQIRGVPPYLSSEKNLRCLASNIGKVEEIEDPRKDRGFLRARVAVDTTKPLTTGCWLPRADNGETWVEVRYERLQDFCYICGRIGHANNDGSQSEGNKPDRFEDCGVEEGVPNHPMLKQGGRSSGKKWHRVPRLEPNQNPIPGGWMLDNYGLKGKHHFVMDFDPGAIPNVFGKGPAVFIEEIQELTHPQHDGSKTVPTRQCQVPLLPQGVEEVSPRKEGSCTSKRELEERSKERSLALQKKLKLDEESSEVLERKQRAAVKLGKMTLTERCSMMVRALDAEEENHQTPTEFQDMWEYMEMVLANERK